MTALALDAIDRRLLVLLQRGLPLVTRPYAAIAAQTGLSENEALARLRRLKDGGDSSLIRDIGPIFDSCALGYRSTLVAMAVPVERIDEAAAVVNAHPGVSHNYLREHRWNLWFTLAVPPGNNVETAARCLARAAGGFPHVCLPALRTFKIGVRLGIEDDGLLEEAGDETSTLNREGSGPNARDKAFIRVLQRNGDIVAEPFAAAADALGVSQEEVLTWMREATRRGWLRRFAAVLYHRRAGYRGNGMAVWKAAPGRVEEIAAAACRRPQVSHCYERATGAGWPYNLFAMIHARDDEECRAIASQISEEARAADFAVLFSRREYKKVRTRYFV